MKHSSISSRKRKSVNLSIDTGIIAAAREMDVNLSRVTEAALRIAVKEAREQRWREDNREAIERFNSWYEENGDPLAHLAPL